MENHPNSHINCITEVPQPREEKFYLLNNYKFYKNSFLHNYRYPHKQTQLNNQIVNINNKIIKSFEKPIKTINKFINNDNHLYNEAAHQNMLSMQPSTQQLDLPQWYLNYLQYDNEARIEYDNTIQQQPIESTSIQPEHNVAPSNNVNNVPTNNINPQNSVTPQIDIPTLADNQFNISPGVPDGVFDKEGTIITDDNINNYQVNNLFVRPESTIQLFNQHFPLPPNLYHKWKHGIKLYPNKKVIINKPKATEPKFHKQIINQLLEANIIYQTKKQRYVANMFCIPKSNNDIRPIFNYVKMTDYLAKPSFVLPSIFQLIRKLDWPRNCYYAKIDIKQAFFNIPINQKSQFVTTFMCLGKYYSFRYLPFGIAVAPFVCQQFCNAIVKQIRQFTKFAWGHLDDIIIAHPNKQVIINIIKIITCKLEKAKWPINYEKSILTPVKNIDFLGSTWNQTGVKRTPQSTAKLIKIIAYIPLINGLKQEQRVRGYVNYYLAFAGKYHSLINLAINYKNNMKLEQLKSLIKLARIDQIWFYKKLLDPIVIHADATPIQSAYVIKYKQCPIVVNYWKHPNLRIVLAELFALLAGLVHITSNSNNKKGTTKIIAYTDNMAVLYMFKYGSIRFIKNFKFLFEILYLINNIINNFKLECHYIKSENNPADKWSRWHDD